MIDKVSKNSLVIEFLKKNAGKKFTAKEVAENIYALYPEFFNEKRATFNDDKSFLNQLSAEVSYAHLKKYHHLIKRQKDSVLRKDFIWYQEDKITPIASVPLLKEEIIKNKSYSEHDLYPKLIEWLKSELGLYCLRIDEKKSSNSIGRNGNKWLHPDIVAMKALIQPWHKVVQSCVNASGSQRAELLSFEVKKKIDISSVREYFFQTVSNSSWANEGYLVATHITEEAMKELRMLSSLHGIGVILLNIENLNESRVLLPARYRSDIDWQSIDRIVRENKDFERYIEYVENYYITGKPQERLWES